jgi:hypothetical protein
VPQNLADFLENRLTEIVGRALLAMKAHARLTGVRVDHIPDILKEVVQQLRERLDDPTLDVLSAGVEHGETRRKQGYTQTMLVDDTRVLGSTVYAAVQNHSLHIQLSNLIPDLSRFNDALEAHLQDAIKGFDRCQAA